MRSGASVRNFGMIWPIGQPLGAMYELARRSRELWLELLRELPLAAAVRLAPPGLSRRRGSGAARVRCRIGRREDRPCELWTPEQVAAGFPAVARTGLRGGLWSPIELAVDPRQVVAELPPWLARAFGVDFAFETPVLGYDLPRVITPGGDRVVQRLVICTGTDFHELAPKAFADSGLLPVKLQMMRSQAFGDRFAVGTHLAAGLTLRHYASFAKLPHPGRPDPTPGRRACQSTAGTAFTSSCRRTSAAN